MNNVDIIKNLITIKIKAIDKLINVLPQDIRESASTLHQEILKAVSEAAHEAVKDSNTESKDGSLKKITIE